MLDYKNKNQIGVTFIEVLFVCAILGVLVAIAVPSFLYFYQYSDINNSTEKIIGILRESYNKTLASQNQSSYGVHFESQKYVLFKGTTYNSSSSDNQNYQLPTDVEIYDIGLVGGGSEVVFDRLTGETEQYGKVSLRLKSNPAKEETIYIKQSGKITLNSLISPPDTRQKDSRHVHVDYSRNISTSTEKLSLNFIYNSSTSAEDIIIADNLEGGQIYWQGEIDVEGEIQKIKIHTHQLNNPDTIFCIHRDKRYNSKALQIEISGDTSGSLIEYSADGSITTNNSIYASDPAWQ